LGDDFIHAFVEIERPVAARSAALGQESVDLDAVAC
jgi:hypothetical protein